MRFAKTTIEKVEAVIYSRDNITDVTPEIGLFYAGVPEGSWRAATFVAAVTQVTLTQKTGPFAPGELVYKGTARTSAAIDFSTLLQTDYSVRTRTTEGTETIVLFAYDMELF